MVKVFFSLTRESTVVASFPLPVGTMDEIDHDDTMEKMRRGCEGVGRVCIEIEGFDDRRKVYRW